MEHSLRKFDVDLRELGSSLGRMGDLVAEQISAALQCLAAHDIAASRTTIARDTNVNKKEIEIEELCLRLLALNQPVASDLRFVTMAMKIATELERIGDRAVNICEAICASSETDPVTSYEEMAKWVSC